MAVGVKRKSDKESIDNLLKRFGKKVSRSGILYEYRDRQTYIKPSKERREAKKEAQKKKNRANNFRR